MSTIIAPVREPVRLRRRERRAERRRLKRLDALSARLAELHEIRSVLERAVEVVRAGWIQDAWFAVATPDGRRAVTAYDLRLTEDQPVVGACLVGAVVEAAGGPEAVGSQLVQRTVDLTWHTLREAPDQPVRWCPGPRMRMMMVLELTHWNDAPHRRQEEVVDLLRTAGHAAAAQQELCRAEQASLDAGSATAAAG